ncbi:golgi family protein, putative [Acanthamoeba castellanii str. Neff]|uniref:Conserved oligomeric Golgi complex subunit 5 n=1 Tax=Acanthamoeba castellanii (strain ATCC 30010 / Neff) TaxID=1257118 RepID=L8GP66_ACACF|nr:golgi family protein, putative [Acanthamoeba castellanii str. Neff]ELR14443.1 golgi family protein, putative [Acanthamoeba castellanii str. Neff]
MDERAVGFNPRTLGDGLVYGANGDVQAFGRGPKTPGQHKTHERNVHAKGDSNHSAVENGNGEGSATPGATEGEKKVPNEALLDKFRTDVTYQQFLRKDFNPQQYASTVLKAADQSPYALPSALEKISSGIQSLNKELKVQSANQHEELFRQVHTIRHLEDILAQVTGGVDSLQSAITSIRSELSEPFLLIQARTTQLERVQSSCDVLRQITRFLYLAKKLRSHLDTQRLPEAAECLYELEQIRKTADLTGIHVVDKETQWIMKADEDVTNGASLMLIQGMETQNQSQVANAIKVFYHLKTLEQKLDTTLTALNAKISQTTKNVLSEDWRAALWTRIERLTDVLHSCSRVILKMKSTDTHGLILDDIVKVGTTEELFATFWKSLTQIVTDELANAARSSQFVETAFVGEYPKLLRLFNDLLKRLRTHMEVKDPKDESRLAFEQQLIGALAKFEHQYLSRSLTHLFEPINHIFAPGRAAPVPDDVVVLSKAIVSELETSKLDERLNASISRGVAKSLKYFAVKSENMLATEAEAYQVVEAVNASQKRNAMIFNALFQLHTAVTNLLPVIPPSAMEYIDDALKQLARVGQQIISPLFSRITAQLEATLLGIHHEGYGGSKHRDAVHQVSAYMEKLQKQIHHFHAVILSYFSSCPAISIRLRALATRVVTFFVRHAALVRPLSQIGTLKLAGDMAQMELALAPIHPLKDLGGPYKELRALRPLIFREKDQILGSPELESLSMTTAMHHMFSRAPEELLSPHVRAGWSIAKYSKWLDEQQEAEVWKLIKASLDAYANKVNQRGDSAFDPIFPVMVSLGNYFLERQRTGGPLS